MSLPKGFDKKEMTPWQKTVFSVIIVFVLFLSLVELVILVTSFDTANDVGQKTLVGVIFCGSLLGALFLVPELMSRIWKVRINFN